MAVSPVSAKAPTLVAHSALLTLTAAPVDHELALRVSRVADHQPINGAGKLTASLDGHDVPLSAQPDGTYLLSTRGLSGGTHSLSVVVSHDGIRELLTGTVPVTAEHANPLDSLQGHGMFAWWVLNIVVVLIAALVISRRSRRSP